MHRLGFSLIALVIAGAGYACSNSNGASGDAGASDAGADCAKIDSFCGQPCEMGNSLGVGQFCMDISDCRGPQARLCSSLGNMPGQTPTYFCTFECMPIDASVPEGGAPRPTECGEGAHCQCQQGNTSRCACTPDMCH
jgi:hypothetical protein